MAAKTLCTDDIDTSYLYVIISIVVRNTNSEWVTYLYRAILQRVILALGLR